MRKKPPLGQDSGGFFVPNGRAAHRNSRLTIVIFRPILETPRHCARRIAATVAHIEIGAVTAGYGVSATAISSIAVVFAATIATIPIITIPIILAVVALSGRLILRSESAIRIAQAVAGAQIPAIAARRRMGISAILNRLNERFTSALRRFGRGHLKGEREASDSYKHMCPPGKAHPTADRRWGIAAADYATLTGNDD
jgi:hypothetical protein